MPIGVDRQAQPPIVGIAHTAEGTGQDLFLLVGGVKPIAIGAFDSVHTELFSHRATKTEGLTILAKNERQFPPQDWSPGPQIWRFA